MEARTVRTVACAAVAALFPAVAWRGVVFPPEGSGLPGGSGGVASLILLAAASLALFAGFRLRSGLSGPGLVAALLFSSFPAAVDAAGSPRAGMALGTAFGAAVLLPLLAALPGIRKGTSGGAAFLAVAGASVLAGLLLPGGASLHGAAAFLPSLPFGVAAGILGGEVAIRLVEHLGRPKGSAAVRWGLGGALVLILLGEGGLSLQRAGTWSDAGAFWERAVREDPASPAALGALARERARAGDLAGAAALLARFVESVEAGGAGKLRGEDARRAGAEGAATAAGFLLRSPGGDREVATAAVAAARRLAPASGTVLLVQGEAALSEGNLPGAIEAFDEAVRRDPTLAPAWDALARARVASGRFEEGLEAAGRATGLDPKRGAYARTLAEALLALDRGPEALRLLKESLGNPPYDPVQARSFADAHGRLARREVSRNNRGRARRLLAAGLQVDPSNAGCQELRATLEAAYAEEKPKYEAFLLPDRDGTVNPDRVLIFAVWLCRWGDFEQAAPLFRKLVAQGGGSPLLHFQMGKEFWEGRGTIEGYEKAVEAYRDALARDPGNLDARNALWRALRTLGRDDEARVEARKFLDAAGAHPESFDAEAFLGEAGGKR